MITHLVWIFIAVTSLSAAAADLPELATDDPNIDRAFAIALADVSGNIRPYQAGLLAKPSPVFIAGAGYDSPWTRDAAINTWNGGGLLWPTAAHNTLLSVLERKDGKLAIGGQYWDAIIWATGAWSYYLDTGDRPFLQQAFEAITNTLAEREATEFDSALGLFRGPAVYGDGIAAYPDRYAGKNATSGILDWVKENPALKVPTGYGLPMHTLSCNCAYLNAYQLLPQMAKALGYETDPRWLEKTEKLRTAINEKFWKPDIGRYITLIDPWGTDDRQEAIGLSFAVLFGVADKDQQASLFRHSIVTPAGMPSLWPTFPRYSQRGGFGRHSGTVWPHAEAFWGDAAAESYHTDIFAYELTRMAEKAVRDGQFYELYNPITGKPDGGLQEMGTNGIASWSSAPHQTWSATGFLRLVLFDLIGLQLKEDGIAFAPVLPADIHVADLTGLKYRDAVLDIHVHGTGHHIVTMLVNGKESADRLISATAVGTQQIDVQVE